jgi:alkanesulfonate monooxygenase SsuD/methylene tetrahydromethanopterin reductase-like flavin-dependent oxidoreductase (luciferase family)
MGMPWDDRGRRSDEHIALLRTLWTASGDLVEFHGEYHDVPLIDPEPRPVQRPIPILVGGHSDAALERAARTGDGWIAASMSPERLATHWRAVREAAERGGRDPEQLLLHAGISRSTDTRVADLAGEYAALGVDHLHMSVTAESEEATMDQLRHVAEEVLPAVG